MILLQNYISRSGLWLSSFSPFCTSSLAGALCLWVSCGSDFPPAAFRALLKGFYFRGGRLWGFLPLSRPSDPGKPHWFLALLVLPAERDLSCICHWSCGGFCCPERPSVFETTAMLMFPCHPFLVFHDDEGEKELPGGLVGRRDFPALPLGAFEHVSPGAAPSS